MSGRNMLDAQLVQANVHDEDLSSVEVVGDARIDALQPLLIARAVAPHAEPLPSVIVGELIAIADEGRTPLVRFPGQPSAAAVRARASVDLHGAHIGQSVVLMFEGGDVALPIVTGVLRSAAARPLDGTAAEVEVEADGARMIVSAKKQLVMRCGKASITLTDAGKVLIQGTYVSSRSSGVNRIKGGSVQLN